MLSESVSHALHLTGGDEASETAHFIGLMDRFFNALNVHNFSHGAKALKPFQMPYTSQTDYRLRVNYNYVYNFFLVAERRIFGLSEGLESLSGTAG